MQLYDVQARYRRCTILTHSGSRSNGYSATSRAAYLPVTLNAAPAPGDQVLLTGATGFVGRRLAPVLNAVGWRVRCISRDAARAQRRWPETTWQQADLRRLDDVTRALDGCRVAYYLVHGLAEQSSQLVERERAMAETFATAAESAGVERIVYLGAIAPQGPPSDHLRSRLEAGRVLRRGRVPTLELRAGMIVGYGSASWQIVRDLSARLPAMVLPRWLQSRSQPVAIDDVIVALATAARAPLTPQLVVRPAWAGDHDLPRDADANGSPARAQASACGRRSRAQSDVVIPVDPAGDDGRLVSRT